METDVNKILSHCDHTLLSQTATPAEIRELIDEAKEFKTASVCIPPCYVRLAKEYAGNAVKICTVIGFPNGYSSTPTKVFETYSAVNDGADEVDVVINVGELKAGNTDYVSEELRSLKGVCLRRERELGRKIILKVIIETCLLTEDEKIKACKIVTESGADYIKTSTGFSKGGATIEDIELFKRHIGKNVKIKAAGGISSLEQAAAFLEAGCERLGSSRLVKLAKEYKK